MYLICNEVHAGKENQEFNHVDNTKAGVQKPYYAKYIIRLGRLID